MPDAMIPREPFQINKPRVDGGPIALIRDGDSITLDMDRRELNLDVADEELRRRRAEWQPLPPAIRTGVLAKYAKLVGSAAQGAVCG